MLIKPALTAHAERQIARYAKAHKTSHSLYVGASEIGMCMRRVFYAKQTLVPVERRAESWGASRRGTTFEDHFWVPAMRSFYGKNLLYAGKHQHTMTRGQLRATPDGLLINQRRFALAHLQVDDIGKSCEICLDCKTADPRINLSVPKPEHEFQAQVQLALFRLCTKHRPDYAVISYTNASFFDDVVEFAIRYDPAIYEQAKLRASQIMKAKDPAQLPPEGWISGGKECDYCPFATPCRQLRGELSAPVETNNYDHGLLEKISALAIEHDQLKTTCSDIEHAQRKLQYEIKELLKAHGLRRITHGAINIVWSPVKGRPALNMPALKAAATKLGLDIQQFETVGEPTDRLVVSIKSTATEQEVAALKQTNISHQ
jgi:hypothetical protein